MIRVHHTDKRPQSVWSCMTILRIRGMYLPAQLNAPAWLFAQILRLP